MNATTPTPPRVVDLDESATCDQHRYTYTRVVRIGDHRVRVHVRRDNYLMQSHAVAEVLAATMTWTHLAAADAVTWFDATALPGREPVHCATELGPIADTLIQRAAAILLD
ncbi:hypothetical protein [Amycolatopsis sp. NPDC059021]|uniref:hypothetical protein n=1 Tax=Amycolatopsis sp. NPDC059021 TaxID=3346704 RepID=UPI003672D89C